MVKGFRGSISIQSGLQCADIPGLHARPPRFITLYRPSATKSELAVVNSSRSTMLTLSFDLKVKLDPSKVLSFRDQEKSPNPSCINL